MILKYYNENADVVVVKLTNKDVQKFLDDYFESAQKMHEHEDRNGANLENPTPAQIALYNTLTDGLWKFNGPLRQLGQIHQMHVDQAAKAKESQRQSIRNIIKESKEENK